ncbi:MAG: hypothetical protein SGARI_001379, partial [Bacillariaceae sp.]
MSLNTHRVDMLGGVVTSNRTLTTSNTSSPGRSPKKTTTQKTPPTKEARLIAAVNDYAKKVVNEKFPHYELPETLPQFSREEILFGKRLGSGFFGDVYEVQDITLLDSSAATKATEKEVEEKEYNVEYWRREIAKRKSSHKQQQTSSSLEKLFCFHRNKKTTNSEWEVRGGTNDTLDISDDDMMISPQEAPTPTDVRSFMKQHCRRYPNQNNDSENNSAILTSSKKKIRF